VAGLYQRRLANGTVVFEVRQRLGGGALRRVRLQATTKSDAIVEQRALLVDCERGEPGLSAAGGLTLNELAEEWLVWLEGRVSHQDPRLRRSPRTVQLNRQRLNSWVLPKVGHLQPDALRVGDVCRLVERMAAAGRAPSTITGTTNVLSALLRYAMRQGYVSRNVVRLLDRDDRPGTGRVTEPRYLTPAEVALLLSRMKVEDRFRGVAAVCAYAGLRVSEALGLRWCDIDFRAGTLTVAGQLGPDGIRRPPKTAASAATLPLLPVLRRELRAHRRQRRNDAGGDISTVVGERLVFTTKSGRPQSRRNALRAIRAAGDAVGLNPDGRPPVGLHDLRHSFVAIALEHGLTLPEAAQLARHANPRVTAVVYAGLADGSRDRIRQKLLASGFGR
jgi:integrase